MNIILFWQILPVVGVITNHLLGICALGLLVGDNTNHR